MHGEGRHHRQNRCAGVIKNAASARRLLGVMVPNPSWLIHHWEHLTLDGERTEREATTTPSQREPSL